MAFVYRLVHKKTGKFYIGSAASLVKRQKTHMNNLLGNRHVNTLLQELFNASKKGWKAFTVESREFDTLDEAREREDALIKKYWGSPLLLNMKHYASGGDYVTNHPRAKELAKGKSKAARDMWADCKSDPEKYEQRCLKVRGKNNPMYGRTHTPEVRERLRRANLGKSHPNQGTCLTENGRERMRAHARTRTGEKNPFYGKTHTPEAIAKIKHANATRDDSWKENIVKAICVEGAVYESLSAASDATGTPRPTLSYRAHSSNPKFANIYYLSEVKQPERKRATTIENVRVKGKTKRR